MFVAALCEGAAIPRWGVTWNWGQTTCWVGLFGDSAISVMVGPGLTVIDGAGQGVSGVVLAGTGGLVVKPQGGWTYTGIWGARAGWIRPRSGDGSK